MRDGLELERVSLRALQARVLERIAAGEPLAVMCERGGFINRDGRVDTTWLQRRAGLLPDRCSRTGKVRRPGPRATRRSCGSCGPSTGRPRSSGLMAGQGRRSFLEERIATYVDPKGRRHRIVLRGRLVLDLCPRHAAVVIAEISADRGPRPGPASPGATATSSR